jgi:hypothetical protein
MLSPAGVNSGKSSRAALSKLLDSMGRCKMAVTKLKRENIQQWFTPDEAARYIFEGDDIDATALDEYLENQELKLYCKVKETSTIQIIDPAQLGMFDKIFMVMGDKPQQKMRLIGNPLTLSNEVRVGEPSEYEFYEPVARYGIEASLECGVYPVVKNKDGIIELELSKIVGKCFLINDTNSIADYMYWGILNNDLLAFDPAPKVIDYGTYFTIDAYQYENKTVEHNSIGGVEKSESLDLGFTRTELDRFIKAQSETTPETPLEQKKQSAWKVEAQNRANDLSKSNPTWLKKKVAGVIETEFKEQNTLGDRGKKPPDYETIYKHIKIKTARRK